MPHASILLKRAVILFGIIWALLVLFLVWTILSIDPQDVSISPSALINAAGDDVAQQVIAFLIFAFGVWIIPVSIAWQLSTKVQRSPLLTIGFVALFALVVYLLFWSNPMVRPTQMSDEVPASLAASAAVIATSDSESRSWACKNTLEVSCFENDCQASPVFTPMSVDFKLSGDVSVCAYSGCWQGQAEVIDSGQFLVFIGTNLPFSTNSDPAAAENIVIALDQTDNVATLKAGAFAQPLLCEGDDPPKGAD